MSHYLNHSTNQQKWCLRWNSKAFLTLRLAYWEAGVLYWWTVKLYFKNWVHYLWMTLIYYCIPITGNLLNVFQNKVFQNKLVSWTFCLKLNKICIWNLSCANFNFIWNSNLQHWPSCAKCFSTAVHSFYASSVLLPISV